MKKRPSIEKINQGSPINEPGSCNGVFVNEPLQAPIWQQLHRTKHTLLHFVLQTTAEVLEHDYELWINLTYLSWAELANRN